MIFQIDEKSNFAFICQRKLDYKISFLQRKQIVGRQKEVAQSFLFLRNFEFPEENFLLYNHNRFFSILIYVKSQLDFLIFQESEDLRERMMTMEAELRALKDELSNRGSSSLASTTSSQAGLKEKDEAILEKPENNVANNETEVATSKNNDDDEPSSMQQKKSHNENPVEISAEENT